MEPHIPVTEQHRLAFDSSKLQNRGQPLLLNRIIGDSSKIALYTSIEGLNCMLFERSSGLDVHLLVRASYLQYFA